MLTDRAFLYEEVFKFSFIVMLKFLEYGVLQVKQRTQRNQTNFKQTAKLLFIRENTEERD